MKIESSNISMSSFSNSVEFNKKDESLRYWSGGQRPAFSGELAPNGKLPVLSDIVQLSPEGLNLQDISKLSASSPGEEYGEAELGDGDKQKLLLIQKMLEMLTGKKIKFVLPEKIKLKSADLQALRERAGIRARGISNPAQVLSGGRQTIRQGWGLEYDYREAHFEKQEMSFESRGVITTSDGREIDISVSLNMSREFASNTNISIRAGDALLKDPLVINFDVPAAKLTERKYSFDLDADGTADSISFVAPGSGFLALDLNGDGAINDGRELFGPGSGDGFKDLASYDSDGNNWIDENDPIYEKLRIWTKDVEGNDKLLALGQKGIGAIFLGNAETAYEYKDNSNETQGRLRKTGIFLKEDGTAGTVQHIDLAI